MFDTRLLRARRSPARRSVVGAALTAALLSLTLAGPVAGPGTGSGTDAGADAVDVAAPRALSGTPGGRQSGEAADRVGDSFLTSVGALPDPAPGLAATALLAAAEQPAAQPLVTDDGAGGSLVATRQQDTAQQDGTSTGSGTGTGSGDGDGDGTGDGTGDGDGPPVLTPAPGRVSGTLVRLWAEERVRPGQEHDHDALAAVGATPAVEQQTWLETSDDAYRLDPAAVADLPDGARLTVRLGSGLGQRGEAAVHGVAAVESAAPPVLPAGTAALGEAEVEPFALAPSARTHEVTVVLARPAGASADSTTAAAVAATVDGAVDDYWTGQSRGTRTVRVVASHGWTSLSSSCADPFGLWNEVASLVGWSPGARQHLLVYLPSSAGCGAGLGTVGSGPDSGGRSWVSYDDASIIAHELGHNMGLGHSNGLLCSGVADASYSAGWASGCTEYEYRDYYDVMGVSWGALGSLAGPHASAMGLLTSAEVLATDSPARVRLAPMSGSGLRVLQLDDPGGTYYVEYRPALSFDSWLDSNWRGLDSGVIVRRRSPSSSRESILLDGSVTSGTRTSDWQSALQPGRSLTTASGSVRIDVESADSTGATVSVTVDGVAPDGVTPPSGDRQVELRSPSSTSLSPGLTVFSGVATAPEGTLLWEVREGSAVRGSGSTTTGANGQFDTFSVSLSLPVGTYDVRVWVPDESDGERPAPPAGDPDPFVDELTVTVS